MISLTRPRQKPPSLGAKDGRAATEREAVIAFFRKVRGRQKFDGCKFEAYSKDDVKIALSQMSRDKCAYCETKLAGQPMAVEHFRPKNEVVHSETKQTIYPGYPWLAYEWSNLLPSCTDCNSGRYQETPSGPRLVGKGNQFPLLDENTRARKPGDEKKEKALLLNPCHDKVERYFQFRDDGFVVPAMKNALGRKRADVTIEICALHRSILITSRKSLATKILADIASLQQAVAIMNANPGVPGIDKWVADQIDKLKMYLKPGEPYLAMAKQYIEPVIRSLTT